MQSAQDLLRELFKKLSDKIESINRERRTEGLIRMSFRN